MTMRFALAFALAATLATAGAVARPPRLSPDAKLAKAIDGRVAGRPTNCISLASIDGSQIIPGIGIVYRDGTRLWVNRPTSGADWLRDDDILVTRTTTSQLCSLDTVRLLDRVSRFERGFVSLGEFVPYTRPRDRR